MRRCGVVAPRNAVPVRLRARVPSRSTLKSVSTALERAKGKWAYATFKIAEADCNMHTAMRAPSHFIVYGSTGPAGLTTIELGSPTRRPNE